MEGSLYRPPPSRRQRASVRRHFRNGQRAAALRAFTAARLYLAKSIPTLAEAAVSCGSNIQYVRAAIAVLQSESFMLRGEVVTGETPLLVAANQARNLLKAERSVEAARSVEEAVATWRTWSPEQRAEFGRGAGVADVWDTRSCR
jgi:hypothetical protein